MLVAYASKHGSTQEVAGAIAAALRELGHRVDLRPADEVKDIASYDAVVLGGSLYMGQWHREARRFLRRHRKQLAAGRVAIFALGPLHDTEREVTGSRRQLDRALGKVPEVKPVAVAIFGGRIDPGELRFPFSHMPQSDARDWDAIRLWAEGLPDLLATKKREEAVTAPR
jgi:menaquinone-dependent protoporphyrinogen oxidase